MNKITIIGRLVADPEQRTTPTGLIVGSFTVAVTRRSNREEADFFPVTAWREMGANCCKYLVKGSQVAVVGTLQIRSYEKDGIKRTAVDIQADDVEFLGSRADNNGGASSGGNYNKPADSKPRASAVLEEVDDGGSLPF